jgi:iron complex outermembrane receptor protein
MTGYKSGGFNARSTITDEGEEFKPYDEETLLAYELGLKSQWLDRRLRANFAIYQNEYDDKQVSQQAQRLRPWETTIINAANATINGFEMDLAAEVIEGLVLTTAYSFSKTKYDEVIDKAGDYGMPGADVSDNWENTFNPEHSITVSAEYRHDISIGEMAYLLSYDWRDEQYTTSAQYVVNPANPVPNPIDPVTPNLIPGNNKGSLIDDYGIVNARVSLSKVDMGSGMQAGIALWIKNVLDEEYVAYQIDGLTEGTLGTFGEPRTLGADFTVQF